MPIHIIDIYSLCLLYQIIIQNSIMYSSQIQATSQQQHSSTYALQPENAKSREKKAGKIHSQIQARFVGFGEATRIILWWFLLFFVVVVVQIAVSPKSFVAAVVERRVAYYLILSSPYSTFCNADNNAQTHRLSQTRTHLI